MGRLRRPGPVRPGSAGRRGRRQEPADGTHHVPDQPAARRGARDAGARRRAAPAGHPARLAGVHLRDLPAAHHRPHHRRRQARRRLRARAAGRHRPGARDPRGAGRGDGQLRGSDGPRPCRCPLAPWTGEHSRRAPAVRPAGPVQRDHPGVVHQHLRRPDHGAGAGLERHRRRPQHAGDRADRVGQDAGRVPVGPGQPGRPGRACARHPGALRVAAQGAGRRRRAQPAHPAGRAHPHRRARRPAGPDISVGVRSGDTRRRCVAS